MWIVSAVFCTLNVRALLASCSCLCNVKFYAIPKSVRFYTLLARRMLIVGNFAGILSRIGANTRQKTCINSLATQSSTSSQFVAVFFFCSHSLSLSRCRVHFADNDEWLVILYPNIKAVRRYIVSWNRKYLQLSRLQEVPGTQRSNSLEKARAFFFIVLGCVDKKAASNLMHEIL